MEQQQQQHSTAYDVLRRIHTSDMDACLDAKIDWDTEGPIFTNVTDFITFLLRTRLASQVMGDLVEILYNQPD